MFDKFILALFFISIKCLYFWIMFDYKLKMDTGIFPKFLLIKAQLIK